MNESLISVLAQSGNGSGGGGGGIGRLIALLVVFAIVLVVIAAKWKVFAKAGQPGWAILIPIYNMYVLLKIVNRPWWWLLLCLVPLVNFVVGIIVVVDLAKSFGRGIPFAIGLLLLAPIFVCILGFGSATYTPIPRPTAA